MKYQQFAFCKMNNTAPSQFLLIWQDSTIEPPPPQHSAKPSSVGPKRAGSISRVAKYEFLNDEWDTHSVSSLTKFEIFNWVFIEHNSPKLYLRILVYLFKRQIIFKVYISRLKIMSGHHSIGSEITVILHTILSETINLCLVRACSGFIGR